MIYALAFLLCMAGTGLALGVLPPPDDLGLAGILVILGLLLAFQEWQRQRGME